LALSDRDCRWVAAQSDAHSWRGRTRGFRDRCGRCRISLRSSGRSDDQGRRGRVGRRQSGPVHRCCCSRCCPATAAIPSSDLYRVKVTSHRANDLITGLILGRSGRAFPRFPRVDLCFPALCGDIVGSTMGSTVDRHLQSGRGRLETLRPSSEDRGQETR
jgi:hypothetical protein